MDNGQHSQSNLKAPDGAISVGVANLNPNIIEQPHTDIQPDSLQRDHEAIGNKIINLQSGTPEYSKTTTSSQGQLKIAEPIALQNTSKQYDKSEAIGHSFDQSVIKTTGDGLDTSGIKELEKVADKKLYKDDDAAGYVDAIRGEDGMAFANLENSYGANSAWKKAA